jgi:uncharacterized protein YhfF
MPTPLPPVDRRSVDAFWRRALGGGAIAEGTPTPTAIGPYGDSVELADELLGLIVGGPKRATAGALADYERARAPLPERGTLSIITDGSGLPRALLRTTDVRVGPFQSVDDEFAWDEGEGDRTRQDWLTQHEQYFRRILLPLGLEFDPQMPVVFVRFEVIHAD